jgi:hypothetical protein
VSAAVAKVIGLGFLPLRLVSFTSSLVAIAAIARIVLDQTGDRIAAVVAAGLFAATYHLSGDWFDVGRLDSLFLALTLLTIAVAGNARSWRGGLVVGLLAFLAFFTKQSALIALAPMLIWLLAYRRRAGVPAVAVLLVLLVGSTVVLDAITHGWYRYYVISELTGQPWAQNVWLTFWRWDLLSHLWPLAVLTAGSVTLAWRAGSWKTGLFSALRSPLGYLGACVTGLLVSAWLSRLHTGGYLNVLLPAYAACAVVGGVVCSRLRARGLAASAAVAAVLVLQLVLLTYPVDRQIPSRSDNRAGAELLSRLAGVPGPILVLAHPWYGTELGKGSFAQVDALVEVLRSHAPRGALVLRRALDGALDRDHVQAVVLDNNHPPEWLAEQLQTEFRLVPGQLTRYQLLPPTDTRSAPLFLYLRRVSVTSRASAG